MPKVRVNYDGWIVLPAAVRRRLKLSTGDQLDLGLSGEILTLCRSAAAPADPVPEPTSASAVEALPPEPSPVAEPEPPHEARTRPTAESVRLGRAASRSQGSRKSPQE